MKRTAPSNEIASHTPSIPWQGVTVADLEWCGLPPVTRGRTTTFGDFDKSRFPLPAGTIVFDAGGPWDVRPREDCHEQRVWIRAVGVVVKGFKDASDVLILSCTRRPPYKTGIVCRIDADCTWLHRDDAEHVFVMTNVQRAVYERRLQRMRRLVR